MEIRRRVSGALANLGQWVTPRDIYNALPDYDIQMIIQELKALVQLGMARHNGKRGLASKYRRIQ